MAAKSDGSVIIAIDADNTGFEKKLDQSKQSADNLGSGLQGLSSGLSKASQEAVGLGSSVQSINQAGGAAEQALGELTGTAQDLGDHLGKTGDATGELENGLSNAEDAAESLEEQTADTAEQTKRLGDEAEQAGQPIGELGDQADSASEQTKDLGDEADKTKDKTKDLGDETDKTAKKTKGFGDKSRATTQDLKELGIGAAAVSATLIAVGVSATNAATEFEAAFAKTQTIMDKTALSAREMKADVLDLSETSGMAAADVSEAVYQAISGSVATADAAKFVSDANQLAVAGFTSLNNATDVLTTTLNAYGLSADKVGGISNVLIQTQNLGKTSVDELASSMGRAISTGSAYGVSLENLSTAYVELTRGGIATTEATTYLSGMLNELGNSGSKVGKVLQAETGKSFGQLMADGWSLADVLDILSKSVDGDSEALMGLWSSQEAGKASNAIMTQGLEDFNDVLRQMDREMSGATTTTRDAYATMTHTSDFVNTRFRNALNNLGITLGDQLNPVLNLVKTGLTDILEGFTDFVEDAPVVGAALAGVTVGVTALAVGVGGLMIAKKAAAAIAALNAVMAANPILLAVAAVAGLAAGIATLVTKSNEGKDSLEDLTVATRALNDGIAETETTCDETVTSIESTAVQAEIYASRLKELEEQGLSTAAAQHEHKMAVEALKQLIPGLNLEIDEQTGLIKGGTEALDDQIASWKEAAVAEAMYTKFKDQIALMADATAELYTNQGKLNTLDKDQERIKGRLKELEKERLDLAQKISELENDPASNPDDLIRYQRLLGQVNQETKDLTKTQAANEEEMKRLSNAVIDNQAAIDGNAATLDEARAGYDVYLDTLNQGKDAQQDQAAVTEEQTAAMEEYIQKVTDVQTALSGYESSFAAAGLNISTFSQTLVDSGVTADEAVASIESYRDRIINATDAISQKSNADMAELISNMQNRVEAYQNWNGTIMQLQTQFGGQLSEEFINFVRGLGPEYNDVVADWMRDGNTQMTEEMLKLDETLRVGNATAVESSAIELAKLPGVSVDAAEDSVVKFDTALDPMKTIAADTGSETGENLIDETRSSISSGLPGLKIYVKDEGNDVGYMFALGIASGIRSGDSVIRSASEAVCGSAVATAKNKLDMHSPSKVAEQEIGYQYSAGVANGIQRGTDLIQSAAEAQTKELVTASSEFLARARAATTPTAPATSYYESNVQHTDRRATAQLQATIEVPVMLDGREIARGTARYTGEQMDFEVM